MSIAITGITGQVGGALARLLRAQGHAVRGVLRDRSKSAAWLAQGATVALADMADAGALTAAFTGADHVFVLLPPNFDPSPGFPETRAIVAALDTALRATRPASIVCISTVGAQATQENLLSQLGLLERTLGELPLPITFLRPAWYLENVRWDLAPARATGVVPSFLQPVDRAIPMVATADVAAVAAELLLAPARGRRVVELEGPARISPDDLAGLLSHAVGRPVRMSAVPRARWHELLVSQGMRNPAPRIRMLDGFNDGWIDFASSPRKGTTTAAEVVQSL